MQFTVNDIIEDSPAAFSQIRVGDRLRMVSSAFDGGAAALESHLSAPSRQKERVRLQSTEPAPAAISWKESFQATKYLAWNGIAKDSWSLRH